MRVRALFLLAVLTGSSLLVPAASASEITLITFIGPPGRAVGETIDIWVEVFRYDERRDADNFQLSVGNAHHPITWQRTGPGQYHAVYTIQSADIGYLGYLDINIGASIGGHGYGGNQIYFVEGGAWEPGVFTLTSRVMNLDAIGPTLEPGETVMLQARSYWNGTLQDAGVVNATVERLLTNEPEANLSVSRSGDGIYQASYTVPATLYNTSYLVFRFRAGQGYSVPFASNTLVAEPLPAFVTASLIDGTHARVRAQVGTQSPAVGARVNVTGTFLTIGSVNPPMTPLEVRTDSKGAADLVVPVPAGFDYGELFVNISNTSGNAWRVFFLDRSSLPEERLPIGPAFQGWLLTNASTIKRGEHALLKFHFVQNYRPANDTAVTYYLWKGSAHTVFEAQNTSTDSAGNLSIAFSVPLDWPTGESLGVRVDPAGGGGFMTQSVTFDEVPRYGDASLPIYVERGALGAPLHVHATYRGTGDRAPAYALAYLAPINASLQGASASTSGVTIPLAAVLTREGSNFTGDIEVPASYPEGDYTVLVAVSNRAATTKLRDDFTAINYTAVTIGPVGSLVPVQVASNFIPGPAALGAFAALGAAAVAARRRRGA